MTYRDQRIATVTPRDPDAMAASADLVLADNRYPQFVRPICEAARRRGVRVVRRRRQADDRGRSALSHRHACGLFVRVPYRHDRSAAIWPRGSKDRAAYRCVSRRQQRAERYSLSRRATAFRRVPVFAVRAVDTLGAGDALHGGSRWRSPRGARSRSACVLAPPSPASSAPAWAAPPARRHAQKSRRCWPEHPSPAR